MLGVAGMIVSCIGTAVVPGSGAACKISCLPVDATGVELLVVMVSGMMGIETVSVGCVMTEAFATCSCWYVSYIVRETFTKKLGVAQEQPV